VAFHFFAVVFDGAGDIGEKLNSGMWSENRISPTHGRVSRWTHFDTCRDIRFRAILLHSYFAKSKAKATIGASGRFLGHLWTKYKGNIPLVPAAYNAGGRVPNIPETMAYVRRGMNLLGRQAA
jgi:hypothetical protein